MIAQEGAFVKIKRECDCSIKGRKSRFGRALLPLI